MNWSDAEQEMLVQEPWGEDATLKELQRLREENRQLREAKSIPAQQSNSDDDYASEEPTGGEPGELLCSGPPQRRGYFLPLKTGFKVNVVLVNADAGKAVHKAAKDLPRSQPYSFHSPYRNPELEYQYDSTSDSNDNNIESHRPFCTSAHCSRHAGPGSFDRHKAHLRDKRNKAVINFDFWFAKNTPSLRFAAFAWSLMCSKWEDENVLDEGTFVKHFNVQENNKDFWPSRPWTRVQVCHLCGTNGNANDTNALEAHNNHIRIGIHHRKDGPEKTIRGIVAQGRKDSLRDQSNSERPGRMVSTRQYYERVVRNEYIPISWIKALVMINVDPEIETLLHEDEDIQRRLQKNQKLYTDVLPDGAEMYLSNEGIRLIKEQDHEAQGTRGHHSDSRDRDVSFYVERSCQLEVEEDENMLIDYLDLHKNPELLIERLTEKPDRLVTGIHAWKTRRKMDEMESDQQEIERLIQEEIKKKKRQKKRRKKKKKGRTKASPHSSNDEEEEDDVYESLDYKSILQGDAYPYKATVFDTMISIGLRFIILVPITDPAYVEQLWHMYKAEGFGMIPLEDLLDRSPSRQGFRDCWCPRGLHYGPFCEHCLGHAKRTGIILSFPPLRDPHNLPSKNMGRTGQGNNKPFPQAGGKMDEHRNVSTSGCTSNKSSRKKRPTKKVIRRKERSSSSPSRQAKRPKATKRSRKSATSAAKNKSGTARKTTTRTTTTNNQKQKQKQKQDNKTGRGANNRCLSEKPNYPIASRRRERPIPAPTEWSYKNDMKCKCDLYMEKAGYSKCALRCSDCLKLYNKGNGFLLCTSGSVEENHTILCGTCYERM